MSNFVRGRFGELKSAASKKGVVLHPLVLGLLQNWRRMTAYASDDDFVFASDRLKGKRPRVPNMLVWDHLRPAAIQVIEIPPGHRFGFHNLRHALTSLLVEIGTDHKTIQAEHYDSAADEPNFVGGIGESTLQSLRSQSLRPAPEGELPLKNSTHSKSTA